MIPLLFGHLFGDYIFQPHWMAWNKNSVGRKGDIICFIHSGIYTITILCFLLIFKGRFFPYDVIDKINLLARLGIMIFLFHYPIDRWSLAKIWMKKILKRFIPEERNLITIEALVNLIVYIVIDNGIHLFLMYIGLEILMPEIL